MPHLFLLKYLYSIFVAIVFALNSVLSADVIATSAQDYVATETDEIQQFCAGGSASGDYALPPSIMYSSIERGAHRRKSTVFDTLKCFSESGAFAFLVAVSIEKFYDFLKIENKVKEFNFQPVFVIEHNKQRSRYCEKSVSLII